MTDADPHLTFTECVLACAARPDLVAEFDRLRGTNMSRRGTPIELLIDDSSGRYERDAVMLSEFVYEYVWCRI